MIEIAGGGLCGLSCAMELLENNFNVTIYEARQEIGNPVRSPGIIKNLSNNLIKKTAAKPTEYGWALRREWLEKELAKQELKKKLEEIANEKRRVEEVERQKKEASERKQEQLRASGGVFNQYDNMFNDMLPPPDAYSARRPDPYANRTVKPASMSLGSDRSHKRMRDGRIIKNRRMLREAQIEDERQKRRNVLILSLIHI